VWSMLQTGMSLDLVREPDNAFDACAVRVDWQGHKLGYVPRTDNVFTCHLLDHGERVSAKILTLQTGNNPWDRIEIALFLAP